MRQTCPAQRNVEVKDIVTYVYNWYPTPAVFFLGDNEPIALSGSIFTSPVLPSQLYR